ncbi:hypothetical protein BD289DRAFT_124598 [Coniella lustricola]|uniref:Uncharacterized protein n=1 Tax=Coniella lustricola TaxID=2025994 RepID=A0A2T3AFT3_9PEZI|nr:hypothetical protein BD289DRAFT_124598 [Coniella lustricola]
MTRQHDAPDAIASLPAMLHSPVQGPSQAEIEQDELRSEPVSGQEKSSCGTCPTGLRVVGSAVTCAGSISRDTRRKRRQGRPLLIVAANERLTLFEVRVASMDSLGGRMRAKVRIRNGITLRE